MKVITGIFADSGDVEHSVNTLKDHGIDTKHIKIVAKPNQKRKNNLPGDSVYDRNLGMTNELMFGLSTQDTELFGLTALTGAIGTLSFSRTVEDASGFFNHIHLTDGVRTDYQKRIDNGETLLSVETDKKDSDYIVDVLKKNGAINTGVY